MESGDVVVTGSMLDQFKHLRNIMKYDFYL